MATADQHMAKLVDAIKAVFLQDVYANGLLKKFGYFPLKRDQRGVYEMKGHYEQCLTEFAALQKHEETHHVIVDRVHDFLKACMHVRFVPEQELTNAFPIDRRILHNYNAETCVCVQLVVVSYVRVPAVTCEHFLMSGATTLSLSHEFAKQMSEPPIMSSKQLPIMQMSAICRERFMELMNVRGQKIAVDFQETTDCTRVAEMKRCVAILEAVPKQCVLCRQTTTAKCSKCKLRYYCSASCQRTDWTTHRIECAQLKQFGNSLSAIASGVFL